MNSERIAWLEIWTGMGGDMFLGALLDAGWNVADLRRGIRSLGLGEVTIEVERRSHRGITGLGVRVEGPSEPGHRGFREIAAALASSSLPEAARNGAYEAFRLLGEAESRIHGIPLEKVHFHEVGALDSIVDIVGVSLGLHELGIDSVRCGPVPLSGGTVEMAHGTLPVPAPATSLLLEGWPVRPSEEAGEFFTPTAAALLRTFGRPENQMPEMTLERVGFGAGTREHPTRPNLLRIWIGRPTGRGETVSPGTHRDPTARGAAGETTSSGEDPPFAGTLGMVSVLETQLDDADPRWLAAFCERLLLDGALDVHRTPVVMKKGRLGTLLTVLSRPGDADRLAGAIVKATTTLGVRVRDERRWEIPRRVESVGTEFGPVRIKRIDLGRGSRITVEYDDLLRLADSTGLGPDEIQRRILEAFRDSGDLPGV